MEKNYNKTHALPKSQLSHTEAYVIMLVIHKSDINDNT